MTEKIAVKGHKRDNLLAVSTGTGRHPRRSAALARALLVRALARDRAGSDELQHRCARDRDDDVAQAVDLAPTIGIPHQNMMIGDREGHIAWTIGGRIPDTTDAKLRLTGQAPWTTAANHPRLMDPPAGRVWTANARPIDDAAAEAQIGGDEAAFGSEYDLGARAKQIHDDLVAIPHATPLDMLKVQTDDNALFLTRWRDLMVQLLDDATVRDHPRRAELKKLVSEWNARATPDAVGYRFVRTFRDQTERSVWRMLLVGLDVDAPDAPPPPQFEGALWELVDATPGALAERGPRQLEELPAGAGRSGRERDRVPAARSAARGARCDPVRVKHPMAGSSSQCWARC